jgi:hypothetical protein
LNYSSGTVAVFAIFSVLLINPAPSFAQEEFDSAQLGFGMPDIAITPSSGPAGTEIEIKVKNMPPPPKGNDPRIEFFVYLPFVTALGDNNVKNNCDGEHCIPLYSFEEINADKVPPKTITFSLFSDQNPKPTLQNGMMESVCDVKINGVAVERYSTVCIDKNQPPGNYEIKFAWGIQRSDLFDIEKTFPFTVTEDAAAQNEKLKNPDDIILDKYKNGEITEEEFVKQLTSLGYNADDIRQAKALLGKLPHQQGSFAPEQKQAVEEGIKKAEEQSKLDREQSEKTTEIVDTDLTENPEKTTVDEKPVVSEEEKSGGCLIATAAYGTEMSSQVQLLREIRDNVLFSTSSGTGFMTGFNALYYSFSPTIADWERQSPIFREVVKTAITPMLSTLSVLNYVDIDSESEMLGYGIGVMLLNIGMYFVMPAAIIIKARKYFKS